MADRFVTTESRIFHGHALEAEADQRRLGIAAAIDKASDDEVLEAAIEVWAAGLGGEAEIEPPTIDLDRLDVQSGGRIQVDCTNDKAGFTMTSTELYGSLIRPGYRITFRVRTTGDTRLFHSTIFGAGPLQAQAYVDEIQREWNWPDELGAEAFQSEVEAFKAALGRGTVALADQIAKINGGLGPFAKSKIEERRTAILKEREFLGGLTIPVTPAEDAPKAFGPPPIVPVKTPAKQIDTTADPGEAVREPQLDEFYGHILSLIRTVGRSLERTPGTFATAAEEALRDLTLVTLNSHYRGATYAEAFNGSGKTDILICVLDHNAFIGECKWWSGPKALEEALEQLFGYLTARDTRAALIFYVPTQDLTGTIEKARESIAERDEFIEWNDLDDSFEMQCQMHAPGDEARVVTVTTMFVHLPSPS